MKKDIQNKKGVTLVELLIYIAVLAIMLGAIATLLVTNEKMKKRNLAVSEVEIQGYQLVNFITQTLRNARSIEGPALGMSSATLSLATDDPAKNPTIFDLSGGKFRIKEGGAAPVELNSGRVTVANLNFTNFGNSGTAGSIHVQFQVAFTNPGNLPEGDYAQNFYAAASIR